MRIIAGKYRGRKLYTLEGANTRPMTDRMKETVFNVIGPYFPEWSVLDLFGGSGALSLESLSRGARHAVIVDKEKLAYDVIMKNVNMLTAETDTNVMLTDYK
ncbi:MAG: RsmD family RNA methyltransferase, partial [Bacilli bacterium]